MFDKEYLKKIGAEKKHWEETILRDRLAQTKEMRESFKTNSQIEVNRVYTPLDLEEVGFDYLKDTSWPGAYPFVRGIDPMMYRAAPWVMMQYSGFASAEETNKRFKYMLNQGATSFAIALDLPTHKALDSDDPLAEGEVGKTGVPIDSLKSLEKLFEGIPLNSVSMFICVAMSTGPIVLALFLALAEKTGIDPKKFGLIMTNEALMEFACRGTQFTTPGGHFRLSADVVEYCAKNYPNFSPLQICGYHAREAGCTAIQELAFPLGNSIAYANEMERRGLSIDDYAGSFTWLFSASLELFEEVAKFRAFRKIWANLTKNRFGAKNPKSMQARIVFYSGGSNLTRHQPYINIARTTIQGLAAALGGIQIMHLSSYDEAYQTPTQESGTIAVRIQQILGHETGITKTIDPLAGSYYVETLTKKIEKGVYEYLERIEKMGGAIKAIEQGFYQSEIAEQAYRFNKEIETKERIKVGLNEFLMDQEVKVAPLRYDPDAEKKTIEAVKQLRKERDSHRVKQALENCRRTLKGTENVIPSIVEAVKAYATVGEIGSVIREVYGTYEEGKVRF
jgi:methylmalonyl-CoA mutase N-terminal domain/subunit